jgi:protein SCO1/2
VRVFIFSILLFGQTARANHQAQAPKEHANVKAAQTEGIGIKEKLGAQLDLSLSFQDENGATAPLSKFFDGRIPVVLNFVYYGCPNLCNFFLNGFFDVLKLSKWTPGKEFRVVTISIDPNETADLAAEKKQSHLKQLARTGAESGLHFLVGSAENTQRLAEQAGFGYRFEKSTGEWAHASAAIILTPQGEISRYLHGVAFAENTFRLSLVEAAKGKIGSLTEQVMLFCFKFDPNAGKYSFYAYNFMRVAAILTILALAAVLIPAWRKNWKHQGAS